MARLPEQRLYDWFHRKMGHRIFIERIENRTIKRATPDLYIRSIDLAGWIELKVAQMPKRPSTMVHIPGWTPHQRNWMRAHATHGGIGWLLVQFDHEVFIVEASRAARESLTWTQADWRKAAVVVDMQNVWSEGLLDALRRAVL